MPTTRKTYIIAALAVLALAVVGALVWYFFFRQPDSVTFNTYVCADESFYFVLVDRDAIEVAGVRYELVSEENGMRYEGTGPITYTIAGTALTVSMKESGEVLTNCEQGEIESAPILEIRDI